MLSIQSSSPARTFNLTAQLPTVLSHKTNDYLSFPEAARLARTSKHNHIQVREHVRQCLKPKFRVGNPITAFQDPSKRRDPYVPVDYRGLRFLGNMGIAHEPLIEKIKTGRYSILEAQQIIRLNIQKIEEYLLKHPTDRDLFERGKHNTAAFDLVECGVLSPAQFVVLDDRSGHRALRCRGVVQLFERGLIDLEHINKMSDWSAQLMTLCSRWVADRLERGELTIKEILRAKEPFCDLSERSEVQAHLFSGRMSIAQSNQLSGQDCKDLCLPVVRQRLCEGSLTISQFLKLSTAERQALKNIPSNLAGLTYKKSPELSPKGSMQTVFRADSNEVDKHDQRS